MDGDLVWGSREAKGGLGSLDKGRYKWALVGMGMGGLVR
jgi:hypothetical protein